jgi:hypothetical protein
MKRLIAWGMFVMIIISFAMPYHASFAANDYTTVSINAPPGDQILIVVDNFAIIEQSYLIHPEPEKQMYAAARSSPIQETAIYNLPINRNLYNKLITRSNGFTYRTPRDGL